MKYYINLVGILLYLCATFGFGVPAMVSAKDTILVVLGFGWLLATPPLIYFWAKSAFLNKHKGEN